MGFEVFWFVPPGISPEAAGFLVFCSAMTSLLSAVTGVGGGTLLIAIMAWIMPLAALIPVHGVVQVGANAGRVLINLREINRPVVLQFLLGGVVGGTLGALVVMQLPTSIMQLGFGAFIIWMAWMKPPTFLVGRFANTANGFFVTFLTFFTGSTGPLSAAVLKLQQLDRMSFVATKSAFGVIQHGIKIGAFGLLGFAFGPYIPFVIAMIGAGFIGSLIGKNCLVKIADQRFQLVLSCMLTVLAVGVLAKATSALLVDTEASMSVLANSRSIEGEADNRAQSLIATDIEQGEVLEIEQEHLALSSHLAAIETDYVRLLNEFEATRSALSIIDSRAQELRRERDRLAQSTEQKEQRISRLTRDLQAARQRIDELTDQPGEGQGAVR